MSDWTEMTAKWVVSRCPYCDDHGYLPNGFRCPHEPPEVTAERAHRGAQLARTALPARTQPARDEPWLPPDLAAETAARLETETQQPEEGTG